MNKTGFKDLIQSSIGSIKTWPDRSPQGAAKPFVIYSHITNTRSRVKKGVSSGKKDTWRLEIVGNDQAECENIANLIEQLDGQGNNEFQGVYIINTTDEPYDREAKLCRYFIDLKTHDRG